MRRDRTNVPRRFFLSDARGASAIEFAVILPPLILMAIAIVDLGQGINRNMEVQNAAQMGAQYAVTNGNDTTAITTVVTESTHFDGVQASPAPYQFCGCASDTSVAEISCDSECDGGTPPGSYITVSAQGVYSTIIPYPLLPSSFTLTAQSTVRLQ
jgi:Flp pilus assembly protein TadG